MINQIVLHQLVKRDEQQFEVVLREAPLNLNPEVEAMLADLHRVFNNKSKSYAIFDEQSAVAENLKAYLQNQQDFMTLSRQLIVKLSEDAADYPFMESSVVVFCHYRYIASDFILIALLDSRTSMLVNEQLDITATHYLNIEHADAVARIDLTEWQSNPDSVRYISFLKGRVGRKVPELFLNYLCAKEGLNPKVQNQGLLKAVEDFCSESQMDKGESNACRQQVYAYCNGQLQVGEDIVLEQLSAELPQKEGQGFQQFVNNQKYELADNFPADRSALRQLTKLSGSEGGLTLSFDAELLDERVVWDPINDTITIKGTPKNLRVQLLRRMADEK